MVTRRNFIANAAATTAALMAFPQLANSLPRKRLKNFGYITGIIGKELEGDWKSVLKKTAEMGYTEIETGKYLGDSATAFLSYCREIGLKPVVGGIGFTTDKDELQKQIDALLQLEMKYAVNYWPWTTDKPFKLEQCKKSAEMLNIIGEQCKKNGLTFCWHNHDNEFIAMEEGLPFDWLMGHTDPQLVKCEMDIYWVAKGGADPLATLKQYSGRIPILHVKDMAPGTQQDFACPGDGTIDFASIFDEASKQGIEHYFVERDNVPDGMACLQSAAQYLQQLTF